MPDDTGVKIRAFLAVFVPLGGHIPGCDRSNARAPRNAPVKCVIYVLMDARTLRERAEHYRELALRIHDEEIARSRLNAS